MALQVASLRRSQNPPWSDLKLIAFTLEEQCKSLMRAIAVGTLFGIVTAVAIVLDAVVF